MSEQPEKPPAPASSAPDLEGKLLGLVGEYLPEAGVIELRLLEPLAVGEMIRITGHSTDITQRVESLKVRRQLVESALEGELAQIRVAGEARPGDAVYRA